MLTNTILSFVVQTHDKGLYFLRRAIDSEALRALPTGKNHADTWSFGDLYAQNRSDTYSVMVILTCCLTHKPTRRPGSSPLDCNSSFRWRAYSGHGDRQRITYLRDSSRSAELSVAWSRRLLVKSTDPCRGFVLQTREMYSAAFGQWNSNLTFVLQCTHPILTPVAFYSSNHCLLYWPAYEQI